eukprot:Clim_evm11s183 gene=Clim_evmTU11s183
MSEDVRQRTRTAVRNLYRARKTPGTHVQTVSLRHSRMLQASDPNARGKAALRLHTAMLDLLRELDKESQTILRVRNLIEEVGAGTDQEHAQPVKGREKKLRTFRESVPDVDMPIPKHLGTRGQAARDIAARALPIFSADKIPADLGLGSGGPVNCKGLGNIPPLVGAKPAPPSYRMVPGALVAARVNLSEDGAESGANPAEEEWILAYITSRKVASGPSAESSSTMATPRHVTETLSTGSGDSQAPATEVWYEVEDIYASADVAAAADRQLHNAMVAGTGDTDEALIASLRGSEGRGTDMDDSVGPMSKLDNPTNALTLSAHGQPTTRHWVRGSLVVPLPLWDALPEHEVYFQPGAHVHALYPRTTAFYQATVVATPDWEHNGYRLTFMGDEDVDGLLPLRSLPQKFVMRSSDPTAYEDMT